MNTSSHLQSLQQQGAPVLLLADLLRRTPGLPAATYHIDNIGRPLLAVSIHSSVRTAFESWRVALGLPAGEVRSYGGDTWVASEGVTADVPVKLVGFGTADDVAAVVELSEAVHLLGALPMPTAGDLAEQRHLIDPLDHVLEHLADERPAVQS
ncbi:hypothetical protein [Streptomyces sp. NPDC057509]|uniref:hypothetical protein n=1 Tax=Streptomyces sp. NPDC057509 TaxID=3346152 RepID=UPI0036A013DA